MSRNSWILLGTAAAAFLAFVLLGGGDDSTSTGGGSGVLGLFRGGGVSPAGDRAGGSLSAGAPTSAGPDEARRRTAASAKRAKKAQGRPGGPPDPELLRRMQAGGGDLVPKGSALAPREGIVQQSFRAGRRDAQGGDGNTPPGSPPPNPDDRDPPTQDPTRCGAPSVQKTVVDLKQNPPSRRVFEVLCKSQFIDLGMGERSNVCGVPACLIYIPRTKSASIVAIFDDRFLVSIRGKCIPDQQYMKKLLCQ